MRPTPSADAAEASEICRHLFVDSGDRVMLANYDGGDLCHVWRGLPNGGFERFLSALGGGGGLLD